MAMYGYFPNALLVKPDQLNSAQTLFSDTNIQISCEGQCHLGAAIGTSSFTESYVSKKVKMWSEESLIFFAPQCIQCFYPQYQELLELYDAYH